MYREFIYNKYYIGSDSIFEGLSDDENVQLEARMVRHEYKKGQVIFREGITPTGIYVLNNGKVKKYTLGDDGKQHIFYVCKKGEVLGHHALLSGEPYSDFAGTLEDSVLSFLPKDDFLAILESSKQLNRNLLKSLSHEFTVFIHSTTVFAQKTVKERLALALLMLKEKYSEKDAGDEMVEISISRGDLANIVGTAKETLVRALHDFKLDNIIETKGRSIKVMNPNKLVRIAHF